jgi:single-stranded DNA-binding protein
MAVKVSFEGYVNEVKQFSWGSVAKVSHSQRAKNDATGEWETVGKDYFDVTLPEGAVVDEGQIVAVEGTLKVGTYEKRDGSTGVALKVRAQSVTGVERGSTGRTAAPKATSADVPAGWEPVDPALPF